MSEDNNFFNNEGLNELENEVNEENIVEINEAEQAEENEPVIQPQPQIRQLYDTYIPYGLTPKAYEERLKIKKSARTVGAAFLIMTAFILAVNIIVSLFIGGISYLTGKGSLLEDPAIMQVYQILFSMCAFTLPFVLTFKISGYRISDLIEFKKPEKKTFFPFFLIGIAFCAFANVATSYAGSIFESFGVDYNVDFGKNPEGFFGFMLTLISTVIVPCLVEEFACRGVVLGALRKLGDSFAVIVSAILFGAMHGNFEQMPFAFLVGLVLGYVTVKSGSVWVAVAIHAFNNFISVLFDYGFSGLPNELQNIIYMVFLCVCMILGIIAIVFNKNTEMYKFKSSDLECTEAQKYKWFFSSALIIIFLVYCVLESMAFFII